MTHRPTLPWFSLSFFCLILLSSTGARAQDYPLPNASFEQWTSHFPWPADPDGWVGFWVTPSSDAHTGASAVEALCDGNGNPEIDLGVMDYNTLQETQGAPIDYRPGALEGWYKLTVSQRDQLWCTASLWSNGIVVGGNSYIDSVSKGSYTYFSIPLKYLTSDPPDSVQISISLWNPESSVHTGSSFILDDVALTGIGSTDAVPTTSAMAVALQCYPNPISSWSRISYILDKSERVRLEVFSAIGERIEILVDGTAQAGRNDVRFDASNLMPGTYFYRITRADNTSICQPMEVMR